MNVVGAATGGVALSELDVQTLDLVKAALGWWYWLAALLQQ